MKSGGPAIAIFAMLTLGRAWGEEQPTISVNTRLVQVEVVVRNKDGPVKGLSADNFTVLDNGKKQKISVFSPAANPRTVRPPDSAAGYFSNRLPVSDDAVTTTVVLLDRLNTEWADQVYGRQQMLRFLRTLHPQDRMAIYTLDNRLRVLQDFTNDPARLQTTLDRLRAGNTAGLAKSDPSALDADAQIDTQLAKTGDAQEDEIIDQMNTMMQGTLAVLSAETLRRRVETTLEAMSEIAEHLAGQPGRKSLVWISGSFPLFLQTRERMDFSTDLGRVARSMNDANVAVYPVDVRGLQTLQPKAGDGVVMARASGQPAIAPIGPSGIDSMLMLAQGTGGRAFYNRNDIDISVAQAVRDSESTYTLGFYPQTEKPDGTFHKIAVKVGGKGTGGDLDIRYRNGYVAAEGRPAADPQMRKAVSRALASPLNAAAIGLTAQTAPDAEQPGTYRVSLGIDLKDFHFERRGERWTAEGAVVYHLESSGKEDGQSENLTFAFTDERLPVAIRNGVTVAISIKAQVSGDRLILAVQDRYTGATGSLGVTLGQK